MEADATLMPLRHEAFRRVLASSQHAPAPIFAISQPHLADIPPAAAEIAPFRWPRPREVRHIADIQGAGRFAAPLRPIAAPGNILRFLAGSLVSTALAAD